MTADPTNSPPAVVITGTSTGIGAACALDLDARGFRVFAGVRGEADGRRLQAEASDRLTPVIFDVTDSASIQHALEVVRGAVEESGLVGLVNNAGILVPGPLELVSTDQLRRQFEVNVVGQLSVIRAFLPLLRLRPGRIVNMGSISGRIAPPFLGPYAASKFAMEAVTDVLRVELRQWKIHVSIVEPDSVGTPIWDKLLDAADRMDREFPPDVRELYDRDLVDMRKSAYRLNKIAMPTDHVLRAVRHALGARRPKTRYPVGWRTRLGFWVFRNIPDRVRDWILLRMMGIS